MTNEAKALQVWIEGSILGAPYLREAMSHAQTDLAKGAYFGKDQL
jgi:hypothetical protein